jgi:hypothetical protein
MQLAGTPYLASAGMAQVPGQLAFATPLNKSSASHVFALEVALLAFVSLLFRQSARHWNQLACLCFALLYL